MSQLEVKLSVWILYGRQDVGAIKFPACVTTTKTFPYVCKEGPVSCNAN